MAEKKEKESKAEKALPAPKEGETPSAYAARVAGDDFALYQRAKDYLRFSHTG